MAGQQHSPGFQLSRHYGTLLQKGATYDIVFERILDHPVKKVWEAITQPEQLNKWFSPNHETSATEIDLRPGGKVRIQLMMAIIEGTITELKKEAVLQYNFNGANALRWELYKEGKDRCRLIFTELNASPGYLEGVAAGWHGYLDFLEMILHGKKVPPFALGSWNDMAGDAILKYTLLLTNLKNNK